MRNTGITGRVVAATLLVATGCGGGKSDRSAESTTSTTQATTTITSQPTTATTAAPSTTAPAPAVTATTKRATTTTTAPPKLSSTQFLVARPGCKNEIDFVRVGADRKVVQSKAVVKAAGNTQLIAYSERDDRLLFGTFNCDTQTSTISEIALNDPKATPKLVASDLDVADADYDYATKAVLVLTGVGKAGAEPTVVSIDSASGVQTVRWRRPAAWKNAATPSATIYPNRLRALTGGEMMIAGNGGKKFVVARVSSDGYTSGGVTGDGELSKLSISILQGAIALSITGSPDLYLCEFGQVYGASQATPITSAPGCAPNPMPEGLTSLGPTIAWAFSGQDGHTLLLAIKDQAYLLDVESLDLRYGSSPPKVYGRATTDVPYSVYAVSVYVTDRDLSKTVPSVTL